MKKTLSLVLALVMLLSLCPSIVAAADDDYDFTIMTSYWTPFDPENNLVKYVEEASRLAPATSDILIRRLKV